MKIKEAGCFGEIFMKEGIQHETLGGLKNNKHLTIYFIKGMRGGEI